MYRIRKSSKDDAKANYFISIPRSMAQAVPQDALYAPEFADEGILFKFVGLAGTVGNDTTPIEAPAWAVGLDKHKKTAAA